MGFTMVDRFGRPYNVNYEDVWLSGKLIELGARECEPRYLAIYKELKKLKRPLKILDIGANMGYFSIRLAEKLNGLFVMIEFGDIAEVLSKLVRMTLNPQLMVIKRRLTLDDLALLKKEEHFDVILALSVIHHFNEPYQQVLEMMTGMCDRLILEHPRADEITPFNQKRLQGEPLDLSRFKKKLLIETVPARMKTQSTLRSTWLIDCNTENKVIKEPSLGLNIFQQLGGIWPNPKTINHFTSPNDPARLISPKTWPSIFDSLI